MPEPAHMPGTPLGSTPALACLMLKASLVAMITDDFGLGPDLEAMRANSGRLADRVLACLRFAHTAVLHGLDVANGYAEGNAAEADKRLLAVAREGGTEARAMMAKAEPPAAASKGNGNA